MNTIEIIRERAERRAAEAAVMRIHKKLEVDEILVHEILLAAADLREEPRTVETLEEYGYPGINVLGTLALQVLEAGKEAQTEAEEKLLALLR